MLTFILSTNFKIKNKTWTGQIKQPYVLNSPSWKHWPLFHSWEFTREPLGQSKYHNISKSHCVKIQYEKSKHQSVLQQEEITAKDLALHWGETGRRQTELPVAKGSHGRRGYVLGTCHREDAKISQVRGISGLWEESPVRNDSFNAIFLQYIYI